MTTALTILAFVVLAVVGGVATSVLRAARMRDDDTTGTDDST